MATVSPVWFLIVINCIDPPFCIYTNIITRLQIFVKSIVKKIAKKIFLDLTIQKLVTAL